MRCYPVGRRFCRCTRGRRSRSPRGTRILSYARRADWTNSSHSTGCRHQPLRHCSGPPWLRARLDLAQQKTRSDARSATLSTRPCSTRTSAAGCVIAATGRLATWTILLPPSLVPRSLLPKRDRSYSVLVFPCSVFAHDLSPDLVNVVCL